MSNSHCASWLGVTSFLVLGGQGALATDLLSSNFDGHDVAVNVPTYEKDVSGQGSATVTWVKDASISGMTPLAAITSGGGFVNQGTSLSSGDNLKLNYNLSNGANQGFSFNFTSSASWDLSSLVIEAAHLNGTGGGQVYASDLNYSISGGTLVSPVTGSSEVTYSNDYQSVSFDLSGATIGAGTYTVQIFMNNLSTGGAYAAFDGVTLSAAASARTPSSGPNVLFILVDDLGWTDHSVDALAKGNASDYYQTPHLERLASEGVSFTSAYAQPNCAPSRAAFFSGQYSCRSANGVYNVASLSRQGGITNYTNPATQVDAWVDGSSTTTTIAEAIWNAGYVTAHFGKYHVGSGSSSHATHPLNQGYDYNYGGGSSGDPSTFYASGGAGSTFAGPVGVELDAYAADYTLDYINEHLVPVANGNDPTSLVGVEKHLTDAMADAFIDFADNHRSGSMSHFPFYAQLNLYAPHTPIEPRADLKTKYDGITKGVEHDRADYAALVEGMDQTIGRVLNYLDDPNGDGDTSDSIASNTLVFFTSDNGGVIGVTENTPLRGYKGMHYEGGLCVPTIVRMPGTVPAAKLSDTMIHVTDYYPTVLDAISGTYPDSSVYPLDGESFWAHTLDPDNVSRSRSPIFFHFPGYMDYRAYACSAVIKEVEDVRYKYIYAYDPYYDPQGYTTQGFDQYQLYNVTDDPSETVNLMDYIDEENASDVDDPSASREYWDYILYKDIAGQCASDLNAWLEGDPADSTWTPVYVTYKSNYPDIDPAQVGQETGPAPATIPEVSVPTDQSFRVMEESWQSADTLRIRFNSELGFTYQIERSTTLDSNSWTSVGGTVTASASETQVDISNVVDSKAFFRVKLIGNGL
ncbi:sulfatase-like hydrolase/transferase [Rubritalea marina]|uniref:sulfatase-like hydrolase/transferase n=1 Tax=Rubritalea marina TaxID=361055 RepID=UPI000366B281|nr:sulfatase-like hydrolase/transferase [Rubritalea marina]